MTPKTCKHTLILAGSPAFNHNATFRRWYTTARLRSPAQSPVVGGASLLAMNARRTSRRKRPILSGTVALSERDALEGCSLPRNALERFIAQLVAIAWHEKW
jgi:hypothetical protein